MIGRVLALSLFALGGCHGEPEAQTGGLCTASEPVIQIGLEKTRLCVGEIARPHASYSNGCETRDVTAEVSWTSTASKVARVESTGKVTAVEPGVANIVAVSGPITTGVRITVSSCP